MRGERSKLGDWCSVRALLHAQLGHWSSRERGALETVGGQYVSEEGGRWSWQFPAHYNACGKTVSAGMNCPNWSVERVSGPAEFGVRTTLWTGPITTTCCG